VPDEDVPSGAKTSEALRYGAKWCRDMFSPRQLFGHCTSVEVFHELIDDLTAVIAIDHEDPRYFVLGRGSGWTRVKYATKATFVVWCDDGKMIPAYSRFISDFSMPFISQVWRSEAIGGGREIATGSIALGTGVANNVFLEFWPILNASSAIKRSLA
jgi:hypothetical protein